MPDMKPVVRDPEYYMESYEFVVSVAHIFEIQAY